MIKAALKKRGVNPNSVRLLALPFPPMRSALNNGQVDAIWTPEPFLSQVLNVDGGRIVMAPGPGARALLADRRLRRRSTSWAQRNPALAAKFRTAINQSLTYAQAQPDEIRDLLPGGVAERAAADLEPARRPRQARRSSRGTRSSTA